MKMKIARKTLVAGVLFTIMTWILLTSCDPTKKWQKEEQSDISSYISSLGDTLYDLKPSGLYYINLQEGTGLIPDDNDTVSIRYKGTFLNYSIFDSNLTSASPLSFIMGSGYIIPGLDEGIRYMKKGGKAKMLTPSSLAYGPNGIYGLISGFTPLLWEIQLVEVRPASKK